MVQPRVALYQGAPFAEALEALRNSARLSHQVSDRYLLIARIYLLQQQPQQALHFLAQAAEKNGDGAGNTPRRLSSAPSSLKNRPPHSCSFNKREKRQNYSSSRFGKRPGISGAGRYWSNIASLLKSHVRFRLYLNDALASLCHLLIDELQGKLNLPGGPSRFADHSKPRTFDRVRRQAHVHHVEHIEELPAELKVGTLQPTARWAIGVVLMTAKSKS